MPEAIDSPTLVEDPRAKGPGPDPMIGRQIRDFRILECLGRGGMGAVYKAEHLLLREPRALKMMRAELFQTVPEAVERFQREARIAVKLRHPNLVLLYDFFVEDGDHYLVMEYVAGQSLAALLRERGALSVEETCRIGIQCCAGLAHAHEMGIVHRDLSPGNIMLTPGGARPRAKIIDFGVARAAFATSDRDRSGDDAELTRAGQFIGKPRYASPEQAGALRRGESLDHRSDLYSLGLILYEMLTGRSPFQADTAVGYLWKHAAEPPAAPRTVRPDLAIPAGLEHVILRCLEKDRARRFATARELGAALEWALRSGDFRDAPFAVERLAGEAKGRRAKPRSAPSTPIPVRRPRLVPIAIAMTLVSVAGAGAYWWASTDSVVPAPAERENVSEAPAPPRREAAPSEPEPIREAVAEPTPERSPDPPRASPPAETVAEQTAPAVAEARPAEPATIASPPEPSPRVSPAPGPDLAPPPAPASAPAPAAPPTRTAAVRRAPERPAPAPERKPPPPTRPPPAEPAPTRFADASDMQRAFDSALAFERAHDAKAAIANWKSFRNRGPTRELDEQAKRRITQLTLGDLRAFP